MISDFGFQISTRPARPLRSAVIECSAACSVARAFGLRRLDAAFPSAAGQTIKVTAASAASRSAFSPLDAFRSLSIRPAQSQSGVKPPQSKASRHSRTAFGVSHAISFARAGTSVMRILAFNACSQIPWWRHGGVPALTGRVLDAQTRKPIAGAVVEVAKVRESRVATNRNGMFTTPPCSASYFGKEWMWFRSFPTLRVTVPMRPVVKKQWNDGLPLLLSKHPHPENIGDIFVGWWRCGVPFLPPSQQSAAFPKSEIR